PGSVTKPSPLARPSPVLVPATATMTATTISQISGLAKPLSASTSAAPGLPGLVTPVMATSAIAMTDSEPSGIALLMMPTMVPMNNANKCQAFGGTPSGTGMTNQISSVRQTTMADGRGLGSGSFCIVLP